MGGFREDGAPPWWRTPQGRATLNRGHRRLRTQRRLDGLCSECGKPRAATGGLCALCAISNRERNHKYWFRKREP